MTDFYDTRFDGADPNWPPTSNTLEEEDLPEIEAHVDVDEAEIRFEGALNQTTYAISVPNDGHDRREEVAFLLTLLPQIIHQSYEALEAQ